MRTPKELYFLDLAFRCAQQGTCLRRNFGAIIVDSMNSIVSSGYSGAPAGSEHCKTCWRAENNIESGSNYEKCRSVHAEQNALLQAGKNARGCDLYLAGYDVNSGEIVAGKPCYICTKMIVNARINRVIVLQERDAVEDYIIYNPIKLLKDYDVQIFELNLGSGYK